MYFLSKFFFLLLQPFLIGVQREVEGIQYLSCNLHKLSLVWSFLLKKKEILGTIFLFSCHFKLMVSAILFFYLVEESSIVFDVNFVLSPGQGFTNSSEENYCLLH